MSLMRSIHSIPTQPDDYPLIGYGQLANIGGDELPSLQGDLQSLDGDPR